MRILGIDYGDVRTGVSVSDPSGILASGVATVTAYNDDKLIEQLEKYISIYSPEKIVLGLPVNMNGSFGPRAEKASAFADKLREKFSITVVMLDERCTTMIAHNIMNMTDTRGKKRKNTVDTLSSEIILQNYLDSQKR